MNENLKEDKDVVFIQDKRKCFGLLRINKYIDITHFYIYNIIYYIIEKLKKKLFLKI